MDQKTKELLRRCKKFERRNIESMPLLQHIVKTTLTDDLMDNLKVNKKKREFLNLFNCREGRKTKIKEYKKDIVELYPEVPRFNTSHQDTRDYAHKCAQNVLRVFPKLAIFKLITTKGVDPFTSETVARIMEDAQKEFLDVTHETGSLCKAKPYLGEDSDGLIVLEPFKFLGKSEYYQCHYLKNRKKLKKIYLLCYPLVRAIGVVCETSFPDTLFKIEVDRQEPVELSELKEKFDKLGQSSFASLAKIYSKVEVLIEEDKRAIRFQKDQSRPYLKTITALLQVFFTKILMNTMKYVVDIFGDVEKVPYLQMTLLYNNALVISPSTAEIFNVVTNFLDTLSHIADDFNMVHKDGKLQIDITDDFIRQLHRDLMMNLNKQFDYIYEFTAILDEEFGEVYDINLNECDEEFTIDMGVSNMENFETFIDKTTNIVSNAYFPIGRLLLSECAENLKISIRKVIDDIFYRLCDMHMESCKSICHEFQMIADKALSIPPNTKELMLLGKFVIWVKSEYMGVLQERIKEMLHDLVKIIGFGTLTPEHMHLNSTTVNWLYYVNQYIDKSSITFEKFKGDIEEKIQATIIEIYAGLDDLFPKMAILEKMDDFKHVREYCLQITYHLARMRDIYKKICWVNSEEADLGVPLTIYKLFSDMADHIYPFFHLLYTCLCLDRKYKVWLDGQFEFLVFEEAEAFIEETGKELMKIQKSYRARIKQAQTENWPLKFDGIVDDPDVRQWPCPLKITASAISSIKEFRPGLTMMRIMCNDALLKRHWKEMSMIAGFDLTPHAGTSLNKLLHMGLDDEIDQYDIISSGATKERELLRNLIKMQGEWVDIRFKTSPYKETGIHILGGLDDVQVVLDDHLMKTLTMRGSIFVKPYEPEVRAFYDKLVRMNGTIDEWGKVQSQWLYLLPIFSSKDIVAQMPEEGNLFKEVNDTMRAFLQSVQRDSRVTEVAGVAGVWESLLHCSELLEQINDGVVRYLEKKRLYFPRFFFLSNDEMLEILSETKDPLRVQPHLKKCFEAIDTLRFDYDLVIHAMFSAEEEEIEFVDVIKTKEFGGSVEKWLVLVETEMIKAINDQIRRSYVDYLVLPRTEWVQVWPGQVVLAVSQMHWTSDMHKSLNRVQNMTVRSYADFLAIQLRETVTVIRDPKLTNLARITIKALIVIDVHAKDVAADLADKKVQHDKEFKWLSQMRYYLEDGSSYVRLINAEVPYSCEYLGNTDRLVITPLTDRCYRTLIGAYHLHLNGAPEGPAGTGKTETTKDLARALAVQCKVFNCSDGLDYKAMGKFFKGVAASGAWVCFDEFNRIDVEVLSVVAQQILSIVLAVRAHQDRFVFEGTEMNLNPACYVCITMNPGYAGRSELPDNLKVLFRTVAMMVPDYAMIGEISLYSFGFTDARNLSIKIVTTYRLCSEQLSSQNHYDYGMRAVKSVLSAAGNNKRAFPNEREDIILLRSILDVNLAKFLSHDLPLFDGIITDLFPGVVLPQADYRLMTRLFKKVCKEHDLVPKDTFLTKVIQTFEMMIVRWGFMMVGEPFAGKSSVLKVLADILIGMFDEGKGGAKVIYQILNPKALTMGQLYGQFDPISYEWFDGVVATCFRTFCTDPSKVRKWIIFDGPVDAVWIENMNSVLDDNKKLCLMSGEVMSMTDVMSLIFEVMDLEQASPATVSRCGMIFMEASNLGWEPFVQIWLKNRDKTWTEGREDVISGYFKWLIPACSEFIRKNCAQYAKTMAIGQVKNMMQMVEMLMNKSTRESVRKEDDFKYLHIWLQVSFIQAGIWGLGSCLDKESRYKFDNFYRDLWNNQNSEFHYPPFMDKLEVPLPNDGIMYDYYYNYRLKGNWVYWVDITKGERVENCANILNALIPTVDTAKYMELVKMHILNNFPCLLVGPTGTGKSFYIQNLLMNRLDNEVFEPGFVTFTVKMSANATQHMIIGKLFKIRRGIYGPPKGKRCVFFIDDMNMPAKEVYGAQPPIELIRQYFDHKHWYDLKTTEKLYIRDVLFIGAMGLVGGSRQEIYGRFLRHFSMFSIDEFTPETMAKIYSNVLFLGWKNNGFAGDVQGVVNTIVQAGLEMYRSAILNLRPTPSKSHYVFNLRDFSRLIQGCALLRKESVFEKTIFCKLWIHEVLRIFYDRLTEQPDKNWVVEKVKELVKVFFKESIDSLLENYPKNEKGDVDSETMKQLFFGTMFDQDANEDEKKYEEIVNHQAFLDLSMNFLSEYNSSHKNKLEIILFDYALEHLSKICRILSTPAGNCLLVGISGSGRQSLVRLAGEMYQQRVFQPEITKNYGLNDWRDDIKRIQKEAGGRGKHSVFLIAEGQIKEESFLQDIDCLLNAGEVPNIYAIDEKQEILEMTRLAAQGGNRNLDVSALYVFYFFTRRCRERIHNILCFSPVGATFRNRLRLFPSLISCCTIDWWDNWPEKALEEVAHAWLEEVELSSDVKHSTVICCKHFHVEATKASDSFFLNTARKTYITSASYLGLIKSYTNLITGKQEELLTRQNRYLGGLTKLAFAAAQVEDMQVELGKLQPLLGEMNKKAVAMLREIEKETVEVEHIAAAVKKDERVANKKAAEAQAIKRECEADLATVMPILEEALKALDTLKPADITLVKSMKNPPGIIKTVLAAVCIIKDVKPARVPDPATGRMALDYWKPSVQLLSDINFLQGLKDFDKDHIKPEIMTKIRKEYLTNPDFVPEKVAKASSAAEGLCRWIMAMDKYDDVNKVVAPKKAKLEAAEKELAAIMEVLNEKKKLVAALEARLEKLNEKLAEAVANQEALQGDVDLCNAKLIRAKKLIGGLGGEKTRWTLAAEQLQSARDTLAGDILISSAIIAYLSPFNAQYRTKCMSEWYHFVTSMNIPSSPTFDLGAIISSDVVIQNWYAYGLPRDTFSTENGVIQQNSPKWPLFIDPQYQASNWIKKLEKKNSLAVVKFSHSDYMRKMEASIQAGRPVLIENIGETLEAALDPILGKNVFKQAGMFVIALGDSTIPYHKNFKLYMCSNLRNPHYLPETFNKVTIINFALTVEGLQDQLLGIVVAVEKPDLQRLKEKLVIEKAENRTALAENEAGILRTLAECKGNILEDESAIKILDESKEISENIMQKQEKALEIEATIEEFRLKYQSVSEHSAVLYYSICDLSNVDPMYQYSLEWFINLYIGSIQRAEKFKSMDKRCLSLINGFTYDLYCNITRSLFEKDKLLFSFILCSKILIFQKTLDPHEYMFALTGGLNIENPEKNPYSWLPAQSWDEICRVDEIKGFKGFKQSFLEQEDAWKEIYDSVEPDRATLPYPWQTRLNPFKKLIVIRMLRPDKILVAVANYVTNEIGLKFINPPPFNIAVSFADSYCLSPLIFILSPGTDPMNALVKFAEEKKFAEKFQSISLGQGQGPIAQQLIQSGQEEGCWVCLQNCHLAVSWMPTLEKIFEDLDYSNTNDNFRLWLTSYPSDKFPVSVLQRGVKITNEPPTGLRDNLKKSYLNDPVKEPHFFYGCGEKHEMFAKLLYGLAFFHAVVQERRTFGPLGWNIPYGFNDSDFDISVQQLQMFINEAEDPYEAVIYLIGECNYGGRVTDDWDRRLIVVVLQDYINPEVANKPRYKFNTVADYYGLPKNHEYHDYLDKIDSLPQLHPPEVFGLNMNAGITRDLQNSNLLLQSVLKVAAESGGGGGGESDKQIFIIATEILTKLPADFDLEAAQRKYPVDYNESMNTVLVQELLRFNKLIIVIRNSMINVQKAIKGLVAMSPEVEAIAQALYLARIPTAWAGSSYPSLKNLPNYVADLLHRLHILQSWIDDGKPANFWISGFFFTQAFLTGVKQNYSRKAKIPIDQLTFDFDILNEDHIEKPPADGAYIYGLFTDGARWDRERHRIAELWPKILNNPVPLIWVIPIRISAYRVGTRYVCPVYKTSLRKGTLSTTGHSTNYVLPLLLDTDVHVNHWIKRSVALLLQLN